MPSGPADDTTRMSPDFADGKVHRIVRRIAHDDQAARGRPGEDPLLMVIDEIERSRGVDRGAGDREESLLELLDRVT